jgi:hypothetical protein
MNNLRSIIEKANKPKKALGRWINSIMLLLISLASFTSFYIIRFQLCDSYDCKDLDITGIWYVFSPGFILFGGFSVIVSVFIRKEANLPSIYSDSITGAMVIAALLMLFIPAGISIEIGGVVGAK